MPTQTTFFTSGPTGADAPGAHGAETDPRPAVGLGFSILKKCRYQQTAFSDQKRTRLTAASRWLAAKEFPLVAKSLVIVESPAKAKTINKFLGRNYTVKASMGHVRDLPTKSLAVDVEKNFAPKYEVVPGRKKPAMEADRQAAVAHHGVVEALEAEAVLLPDAI